MKSHSSKNEVKELQKKAKKGDPAAQFSLGWMYANGQGVPQNDVEAARYYTQVVENDPMSSVAQFSLGFMYIQGRGVEIDHKKAMELFSKAAALNHPNAQFYLGFLYLNGWGVTRNEACALEWFRKAAAQEDLSAIAQIKILERGSAEQNQTTSCGLSTSRDENKILEAGMKEENHPNAIATPDLTTKKTTLRRKAVLQRTDWLQKNAQGNIFHSAAKNAEVFKILLEMVPKDKKDMLLTATNSEDNTPLHLLAHYGQESLIEKTIEVLGAEAGLILTNLYNDRGYLPIHEAAESGKKKAIDALVKAGADVNALTKGGLTMVQCAQHKNHTELAKDLEELLNTVKQDRIPESLLLKPLNLSMPSFTRRLAEDCIDDTGIAKINLLISYDKLEINKYLDKGSFGEVHKGKYLGMKIAIKTLFEPRKRDEMLREAGLMIQLIHPNVVRLYGIVLEPQCCIVLEFMEKGSLYALLHSKGELNWPLRYQITLGIARGLAYLHENKIFHRDIKSLNILLNKHNEAKISDFGLSTATFFSDRGDGKAGTFAWMAPELFRGNDYDFPCDVYSFAIVLWEIMTRCNPYAHTPMPALIIRQVLRGERPKIPEEAPLLLKKLAESCWGDDPDKRLKMKDILDSLEKERVKDATAILSSPKEPSSDENSRNSYFSLCFDHPSEIIQHKDREGIKENSTRGASGFFASPVSEGHDSRSHSRDDYITNSDKSDYKEHDQEISVSQVVAPNENICATGSESRKYKTQGELGFFTPPVEKSGGLLLSQSHNPIKKGAN